MTGDQDFSTLALLTFGSRSFFVVGACPVYRGLFSRTPGLCPPDPVANSFYSDSQNCVQTLPNIPGGKVTLSENCWFR